jgi:hypothetical protein
MERWLQCYNYPEPYKLILDDDLLPSRSIHRKVKARHQPLIGIYGKSGVE